MSKLLLALSLILSLPAVTKAKCNIPANLIGILRPTGLVNIITDSAGMVSKGSYASTPYNADSSSGNAADKIIITGAFSFITAGVATGSITACAGSASVSPRLQQFTVAGKNLTGSITATAPAGFELSLNAASGFGADVILTKTDGIVGNTIVYVRSAARAAAGNLSGNVSLSSPGAQSQTVAVTGIVNALPTVNKVAAQTVITGGATTAINFSGTGNTAFTWVNDTPGIGLAATGSGNISSFAAINTGSSPVTATITATPLSEGYAYITTSGDGTISVINVATNTVVSTIRPPGDPTSVCISPDGSKAYIGCAGGSNTIIVVNTLTNLIIKTITVNTNGENAGITVSPDGNTLYVTDYQFGTVSAVNIASGSVVAVIPVGQYPYGIAISPDGSKVYVGFTYSSDISIINTATNTVAASVTVGLAPPYVAVAPDGKVYVPVSNANNVAVIDPVSNSIIAVIPTGAGTYPGVIAVTPDGTRVYVATGVNDVSVINTATHLIVATISVGLNPSGICVSPDGHFVYVANTSSQSVSVINTLTNKVVATVNVGIGPVSLGNFVTAGTGCAGAPITFTITVNPVVPTPAIVAGNTTGNINACSGAASVSPNIQQLTVSGSGLTNNIFATAPAGFEISLKPVSGFLKYLTLIQTSGKLDNTVIYVRSAASGTAGSITGNIVLISAGATNQSVAVTGTINPVPIVNQTGNQIITNNTYAAAIDFSGTADTFNWTNDTPDIGLPAAGTGNIPSFKGIDNGNSPVTATLTVTPLATGFAVGTGCSGVPVTFTITVNPPPSTIVSYTGALSPLTTTYGTPSQSTSFSVSGANITSGILVTPPSGFEVSIDNINFSNSVTVGTSGTISSNVIYLRIAAVSAAGNYSGNIVLSTAGTANINVQGANGTVNPRPLTVTIDNLTKTYGTELISGTSSTAFSSAGLKNNETIGSITLIYGSGLAGTDEPGTYSGSIIATAFSGGTFIPGNYIITYKAGNIIIIKAPLTITADNKMKAYGSINPVLTVTYTGFVNNESPARLTGLPEISTTAILTSPAGNYPIEVSGGSSPDYAITTINGTLTIFTTIIVPNAFTPNSDGINDVWDIRSLSNYARCNVSVFSRYGSLIYQSTGYPEPWDGTFNNKPLPVGTYYYIINLQNGDRPLSGPVTIIR